LERSPLVVELAGAPSSGPAIARSDSPRAPPVCCWRAAGPASGGRGPRAPATDALVERLRSFSSEVKWCRPRPARLPNIWPTSCRQPGGDASATAIPSHAADDALPDKRHLTFFVTLRSARLVIRAV